MTISEFNASKELTELNEILVNALSDIYQIAYISKQCDDDDRESVSCMIGMLEIIAKRARVIYEL